MRIYNRNNFLYGCAIAIAFIIAGLLVMYGFNRFVLGPILGKPNPISTKVQWMGGLSACVIPANNFLIRHRNASARGVMMVFFLVAAYIIYQYFTD